MSNVAAAAAVAAAAGAAAAQQAAAKEATAPYDAIIFDLDGTLLDTEALSDGK